MSTGYRAIVNILFRTTDALVISAVWLLSYYARLFSPQFTHKTLPPFDTYASLVPLIILLWVTVLSLFGAYQTGRMSRRKAEVLLIVRAHIAAVLIFVALTFMFDAYKYSRLVMIYFATFGAFGLAAFRFTLRTILRAIRRRGFDVHRVVIAGEGETAKGLLERFASFPEIGMTVAGLVTRDGERPPWAMNIPAVGRFADTAQIVEFLQPDEVLVALRPEDQSELAGVLAQLRDSTANVRVVHDVHNHVTLGCEVEQFEGMAVIRLNDAPSGVWQALAKRVMDAALAAIGLVLLAPLLVFLGVLVKCTSPGPVLYVQERMGLDGRTFQMLKFRSMRVDAEAQSGATWTTRNDSRRTAIGAILRKTSLDELPQLWNVLVGHMSLVGPRPERPVFVRQFRQQIPDYMLRHKVKSGITGWAQVNGWRGDTSVTERTACDLYYIRNWSLDLDVKILVLTLWKGFFGRNAY